MEQEEIIGGARSVLTIGRHLQELQAQALAMPNTSDAQVRGYLTPSEDEAARHLLVSYWQSRCALLETVYSFRRDAPPTGAERCPAFLVAFAGALVLIDAARFLREQFHERKVIRAKLNEPEPHFGIPGGVYDAVQKSLTSPMHAWQLYHAFQFWNSMQGELRQLGKEPLFGELLDLIDRLKHRLDATVEQYTVARMRLRTRQAWTMLKGDLFLSALYGIQKVFGTVISEIFVQPGHRPQLPPAISAELREALRPGDVMITRKEHALTNYFLPGFWPHAALYLGDAEGLVALGLDQHASVQSRWAKLLRGNDDEPKRVLEAMKDGVFIRSLKSPMGVDSIAVLRPKLEREQIAQALSRGLFHEGKSYDFDFDFSRSDRLVCTEVVYRSYEGIGPIQFKLKPRAGRFTLAAEDLIDMALAGDGFEPFAAYCGLSGPSLRFASDAAEVLNKTRAARLSQGGQVARE